MSQPSVEFHFDFGSPNAYFAHRVIPDIEERTGVPFRYVPVLLGGVFKATGNQPPMVAMQGIRNKPEYFRLEMERFRQRHDLDDFRMNPHFPVNTLAVMRGALVAERLEVFDDYVEAVFHHLWEGEKKMDDPEVIRAALAESGLPADELIAGAQDPEIKQQLIDNTAASVERGTFGIPTFFVDGEIWFGKDRLRDVEEEILRRVADC